MNRRQAIQRTAAATFALATHPVSSGASYAPVAKRVIPSTGERLPCVGLGTWLTFDIDTRDEVALAQRRSVVSNLLREGGALIDSSPMYGQSEQVVGKVVDQLDKREQLFLASKVWTHGQNQGIRQMAETADKMEKRVLDLLQIHNLMDWETHMRTLQAMKERQEVRYIGITHYLPHAYGEMEQILVNYPIDFIQVNYNVTSTTSGDRLLSAAKDHGKAVIINRPFAGGSAIRQVRNKPLPKVAQDLQCVSWAQLLLKFVLSHPAVTCAIPGTRQPTHMTENVRTGQGPFASARECKLILDAFKK